MFGLCLFLSVSKRSNRTIVLDAVAVLSTYQSSVKKLPTNSCLQPFFSLNNVYNLSREKKKRSVTFSVS